MEQKTLGKKKPSLPHPQTSRCEPTLQHHEQHLSKRAWDIRSFTRRNIQLCQADTPGGQDSREGLVPAQLAQLCGLPDAAVPHGSHGSIPGVRGACPRGCAAVPSVAAGTRRHPSRFPHGPQPTGQGERRPLLPAESRAGYSSQTGCGAAKAARAGTKMMYSERWDSSLTLQHGIVWVPLSSGG